MLTLSSFIKKNLELQNKLPAKWKPILTTESPLYTKLAFTVNSEDAYLKCPLTVGDKLYTKSENVFMPYTAMDLAIADNSTIDEELNYHLCVNKIENGMVADSFEYSGTATDVIMPADAVYAGVHVQQVENDEVILDAYDYWINGLTGSVSIYRFDHKVTSISEIASTDPSLEVTITPEGNYLWEVWENGVIIAAQELPPDSTLYLFS